MPPIYDALLDLDLELQPRGATVTGGPVIYEIIVEKGSYLDGCKVGQVPLPQGCQIVSLLRGPAELSPPLHLHLQDGDVLVIVAEYNDPHVGSLLQRMGRATA